MPIVVLDLALPSTSGSALVELIGLLGVLAVTAAILYPMRPTRS